MASQPVSRLFWRYTIPSVTGMLVNGLYSTIDGIFIGQVVGADGLAAINLVWAIFGVIVGIGLMIGMGTSALSSIARGEGDLTRAKIISANGLVLMVIASIVIIPLLLYLNDVFLSLMGGTGNALLYAREFLIYITFFSLFAIGGAALPMMVRNDERPKLATIIMSVGALLNILLDYLFIIVWKQGVAGAAIATIIAQAVTMIWGIGYFFSNKALMRLSWKQLGFNLQHYRNILITGMPSLIMFAYMSFVLAVHNRLFLNHGTVTTLAAFTIVGCIQVAYYMIAEGIANGIQPVISFNYGAGNNRNIHAIVKMGCKAVLGFGIASIILINLFPKSIALAFNTSNTQLIEETVFGLRLHLATMFLDGFIVVAAAYFQSVTKTKAATIITLGNMFVQVPLLFVLPSILGVTGVWISLPLSNIVLAAAALWLLVHDLKSRPV